MLTVKTAQKRQVLDITDQVEAELKGSGLANILVKHTTAAITLADLDPGTDADILDALEAMTPQKNWRHPHDPGHFPDHLWSAIIGPAITLPYEDGKLTLGTWQRLILIELDGPRERQLTLTTG
ncbi:MAG TPA: secondary thiamine-phosphate synthase enzyme YjbQ [Candidatus Saccharimonadia bacterium]|nr:secondary thiamine-phosphate synthase enzyme YjbQ [Candidatus Saccharimonadia bacterium]